MYDFTEYLEIYDAIPEISVYTAFDIVSNPKEDLTTRTAYLRWLTNEWQYWRDEDTEEDYLRAVEEARLVFFLREEMVANHTVLMSVNYALYERNKIIPEFESVTAGMQEFIRLADLLLKKITPRLDHLDDLFNPETIERKQRESDDYDAQLLHEWSMERGV